MGIAEEYLEFVVSTESGPLRFMSHRERLLYFAVGLVGEAGEAAEKVKKIVRDEGGRASDPLTSAMMQELGDVMWYAQQLLREVDLDFNSQPALNIHDLLYVNMKKLKGRVERETIQGSGDNR